MPMESKLSKKVSKSEREEEEKLAKTMLAKADEIKAEKDKELEERFAEINDKKK